MLSFSISTNILPIRSYLNAKIDKFFQSPIIWRKNSFDNSQVNKSSFSIFPEEVFADLDDVCFYAFKKCIELWPDRGVCKDMAVAKAKAYFENRKLTSQEINYLTYKNGVNGAKKSKKGDFGYVYEKDGRYFIDFNFQIRFR